MLKVLEKVFWLASDSVLLLSVWLCLLAPHTADRPIHRRMPPVALPAPPRRRHPMDLPPVEPDYPGVMEPIP